MIGKSVKRASSIQIDFSRSVIVTCSNDRASQNWEKIFQIRGYEVLKYCYDFDSLSNAYYNPFDNVNFIGYPSFLSHGFDIDDVISALLDEEDHKFNSVRDFVMVAAAHAIIHTLVLIHYVDNHCAPMLGWIVNRLYEMAQEAYCKEPYWVDEWLNNCPNDDVIDCYKDFSVAHISLQNTALAYAYQQIRSSVPKDALIHETIPNDKKKISFAEMMKTKTALFIWENYPYPKRNAMLELFHQQLEEDELSKAFHFVSSAAPVQIISDYDLAQWANSHEPEQSS